MKRLLVLLLLVSTAALADESKQTPTISDPPTEHPGGQPGHSPEHRRDDKNPRTPVKETTITDVKNLYR